MKRIWMLSLMLAHWVVGSSLAQDTLTYWDGSKRMVHITRMDRQFLYYKTCVDSKHERSVDKEKLMKVGSRDSAINWERVVFDKSLYGTLPADSTEIDRMANWQVDYFYHGDKVVGRMALFSTIIGTPIIGLGYSLAQTTKEVPTDRLGLMGNPHAGNPIYLDSYARHAKRKNKRKIWRNWVGGTMVYAIPLGIAAIAISNMSLGIGSSGW